MAVGSPASVREKAVVEPPKGEHIFPNTRLTAVCLKWKDLTAQAKQCTEEASRLGAKPKLSEEDKAAILALQRDATAKHGEAFVLLEQVIIESTPMFERLAQYEGYHYAVDLPILVQAAREKVPRWLQACDVQKLHEGKLFSWMSTCAKHAFLSEVGKQKQHTTRFHATSDSLEKFVGSEDHEVDRHDLMADIERRVRGISVRWGDPQELGAVRFIVECLRDVERQPPNKVTILNGARYAFGLSEEMSKFFYQWALFALRDALYDKRRVPFTRQDVLRLNQSYSFLPDVIDIVGWDAMCRLIKLMGGQRIKLPTLVQLDRMHRDALLVHEIDQTDLTPEAIEGTAKRRGVSAKSAGEIYSEMTEVLSSQRMGEHPLYED